MLYIGSDPGKIIFASSIRVKQVAFSYFICAENGILLSILKIFICLDFSVLDQFDNLWVRIILTQTSRQWDKQYAEKILSYVPRRQKINGLLIFGSRYSA